MKSKTQATSHAPETVLSYTAVFHPAEEGGFWVSVPALPGCFSQGDTFEEARQNVAESIRCHVDGLVKDGESVPTEKHAPLQVRKVRVGVASVA
ncbi:MAG: type II toxin-antitoxin system HicB family antitoxin [Deltaproteobacteria bacterium]|nr:type II toxin-antitoxin system HicB family antitoxin [Deltaproteobacteria bacterium]